MKENVSQIGSLTCHVIEASHQAQSVFILCHGFGAPGSDLVPIARMISKYLPATHFVMPQGPLDLSQQFPLADARAWWEIEVGHIAKAIELGQFQEIQESVPAGLASARRKLLGVIELLSQQYQLPLDRFILGGFSQGAMLATDVALSMEESPLALSILSGTLICKKRWGGLAQKRPNLKVFQSHGRIDPLLPFSNAIALKELLEESGIKPDFLAFEDQHTIPVDVVGQLGQFLANHV
ncbi:MAG: phospholipase [Oligoflexales bacterium]|nr:phospholipase [Oligoflexales bacterium]